MRCKRKYEYSAGNFFFSLRLSFCSFVLISECLKFETWRTESNDKEPNDRNVQIKIPTRIETNVMRDVSTTMNEFRSVRLNEFSSFYREWVIFFFFLRSLCCRIFKFGWRENAIFIHTLESHRHKPSKWNRCQLRWQANAHRTL